MMEWPVIDEDSRLEDLERFESLVERALEKAFPKRQAQIKESTHGGTMSLRNHLKK